MSARRLLAPTLIGCAAATLGGCVAAVVPVAAGGLIGRQQLRGHHTRHKPEKPAAAPIAASAVTAAPLPSDAQSMAVGTLYTGQLPAPDGSVPPKAPTATQGPSPASRDTGNPWTAIVHYVAAISLNPPTKGVLLVRGSTAAIPNWVPCDQKPLAVVIGLGALAGEAATGPAVTSIGAIETMGLTPVYLSNHDAAASVTLAKPLSGKVMTAPVDGKTLFLVKPGGEAMARATIAARYCVIALVGTRAADFPNGILPSTPGASPGWFLVPGGS